MSSFITNDKKLLQRASEPIFVQWRITKKKKNEIISDQKSALAGRSRFRFLFVAVDVYMERKSRFLRAKNALVECFLYL